MTGWSSRRLGALGVMLVASVASVASVGGVGVGEPGVGGVDVPPDGPWDSGDCEPDVDISPTTLEFSSMVVVSETVTFTNSGCGDGLAVFDLDAGTAFALSSEELSVPAGAEATLEVTYTPESDPSAEVVDIDILNDGGFVVGTRMSLLLMGVYGGEGLVFTPEAVVFPSVEVGASSVATVTVINSSSSEAWIRDAVAADSSVVVLSGLDEWIDSDANLEITLEWTPTVEGPLDSRLLVDVELDALAQVLTVPLSGETL